MKARTAKRGAGVSGASSSLLAYGVSVFKKMGAVSCFCASLTFYLCCLEGNLFVVPEIVCLVCACAPVNHWSIIFYDRPGQDDDGIFGIGMRLFRLIRGYSTTTGCS